MIAAIRGTLLSRGHDWVVVDVNGVGYRLEVPAPLAVSQHVGDRVAFHTHLVVRDDALTLYGFDSPETLEMFTILLGVSGVGPRSALGVMSELTPVDVAHAVANDDPKPFQAVSGIGAKTAKLIVVSLAGKLDHIVLPASHVATEVIGDREADAVGAQVLAGLVGLGWTEAEAQRAVDDAREAGAPGDASGLLKAALALLQKPSRGV